MQARLTGKLTEALPNYVRETFDRPPSLIPMPPSVDVRVRYFEEKGRLFLMADVRELGKPKKPIKEFCRAMSNLFTFEFPLEERGYQWQFNALGILLRDSTSSPQYRDVVQKLIDSVITVVSVTSYYKVNDKTELFVLTCRKQGKDQEFEYFKYSGVLGNTFK
jgi:hypothetical protein